MDPCEKNASYRRWQEDTAFPLVSLSLERCQTSWEPSWVRLLFSLSLPSGELQCRFINQSPFASVISKSPVGCWGLFIQLPIWRSSRSWLGELVPPGPKASSFSSFSFSLHFLLAISILSRKCMPRYLILPSLTSMEAPSGWDIVSFFFIYCFIIFSCAVSVENRGRNAE